MLEVLQAGRVVGGHFRLQSRLGEGDTARLWAAEDVRATGAGVVVEFMPEAATSASARARFEREGRAWLAFHCPQVARVIDQGVLDGNCAFRVIEQLRGETLERVLERERALKFDVAAVFVEQLCHAIARLEASGLPVPVLDTKCVFVVAGASGVRGVKLLAAGAGRASRMPVPEFGRLVHRMLTGGRELPAGSQLPADLDEWFRAALHEDRIQRFPSVEQAGLAFGHIARAYQLREERRGSPTLAKPAERLAAPRTDDPALDAVMIDPGVLGPRSNRGFRKRAGLALSALVALALGVVGGFVLRTALQNGLHLAHRGEVPASENGSHGGVPEALGSADQDGELAPPTERSAVAKYVRAEWSPAALGAPADQSAEARDARAERSVAVASVQPASAPPATDEAAAQRLGRAPSISIARHGSSAEVMPAQSVAPRALEGASPGAGEARLAPGPRVYRGF